MACARLGQFSLASLFRTSFSDNSEMLKPFFTTKDIEIFRTGTHTAMDGRMVTVTSSDLAEIANRYDPTADQAPIVVGHPATNSPAYGWVTKLRIEGDRLVATAEQVDPAFAELVRAGRYKKISASFKPVSGGGLALRHVGFLGATPPAVKGLKETVFAAESAALTFDFPPSSPQQERSTVNTTEAEHSAATQAQIRDMEARLVAAEAEKAALAKQIHDFAEGERANRRIADRARIKKLVGDGRILPRQAGAIAALIEFLDGDKNAALEFAEGDNTVSRSPKDTLFTLLEGRSKGVDFGAFIPNPRDDVTGTTMGSNGDSINFSDPVAIADAAAAYQAELAKRGTTITSADAVLHVMKGKRP